MKKKSDQKLLAPFSSLHLNKSKKKEMEENHFIFHCVSCRYLIPAILNVSNVD